MYDFYKSYNAAVANGEVQAPEVESPTQAKMPFSTTDWS